MQDSLGGNAKTLMFVNCSPSVYNRDETKNSLEYAKRVRDIKNNATLNTESRTLQRAKALSDAQNNLIEDLKSLMGASNKAGELQPLLLKHATAAPSAIEEEKEEFIEP